MSSTPDARSRDISTMATLGMYLLLLIGISLLNGRQTIVPSPPVRGETVLRLRVNQASAQATAPPMAAEPEPQATAEPVPAPVPKPKPVPAPSPEPSPDPLPEPEPRAEPPDQAAPLTAQADATVHNPSTQAQESSPAAGDPEGEARQADLLEQLLTVLRQHIERAKQYPFAARKAGITGTVLVRVSIDPSGMVSGYQVINRGQVNAKLVSGAEGTMDALHGIRLGDVALPSPLKVEVPIVYQLN